MTRGQRDGALTRAQLIARLKTLPDAWAVCGKSVEKKTLMHLTGHCIHYSLLSKKEVEETVPRSDSTLPCYLHTYITKEQHRQAIETYVVAASKLYRRGTLILNLIAQKVCGPRLPGASDIMVSVLRPRFDAAFNHEAFGRMAQLLQPPDGGTIEENTLKHAFLPERWPSSRSPLDAGVDAIVRQYPNLPGPPDWMSIMSGTGWDNAINRMMSKFAANIKVHACARIAFAAKKYMSCVPLDPETARWLLTDCTVLKLRPIIAANDDWEMAMTIRRLLMGETNGEYSFRWVECGVPEKTAYTPEVLLFHLFLARFGVAERSYLPVASRSRKYAYIDTKVAHHLFKLEASSKKVKDDEVSTSTSVGQLLGLTPAEFNKRRKQVRAEIRRRYRAKRSSETNTKRKEKLAKMAKRWSRIGSSHMPAKARVDSIETDGVGLRLILKVQKDISSFVKPMEPPPSNDPVLTIRRPRAPKAMDVVQPLEAGENPIMVTLDTGRAKLFSAAISTSAVKKPATQAFKRTRYYHEMKYMARMKWEQRRMQEVDGMKDAVDKLSRTGGTKNCDPEAWSNFLRAEAADRARLDAEFVSNVDRAKWGMLMHRRKKSSLDQALARLIKKATENQPMDRPLVIGVGDGGFPSCGRRGELPAPTSELSKAITRAVEGQRKAGRVVKVMTIHEYRTTMCCSACGAVTTRPRVQVKRKNRETGEVVLADGPSCRLRCCTSCSITGKLRDRDVQGARNILWAAQAVYFGFERPSYLTRGGAVTTNTGAPQS